MRFNIIFFSFLMFLSSAGYADEYFFKKVAHKNITPEETGNLTLSESKYIALKEAMLHSKIMVFFLFLVYARLMCALIFLRNEGSLI